MVTHNTQDGSGAQATEDLKVQQPQTRRIETIEELALLAVAAKPGQQKLSALGRVRSAMIAAGRHDDAAKVRATMDAEKANLPAQAQQAPKADRQQNDRRSEPRKGHRSGRRGRGNRGGIPSQAELDALHDAIDAGSDRDRAENLGKLGNARKRAGDKAGSERAYALMHKERRNPGCTRPRKREERQQGGGRREGRGNGQRRGISRREHDKFLENFDHVKTPAEPLHLVPREKGPTPPPSGLNRAQRRALRQQAAATPTTPVVETSQAPAPEVTPAEAAPQAAAPEATAPDKKAGGKKPSAMKPTRKAGKKPTAAESVQEAAVA